MQCPKCNYTRQPQDRHIHQGICPQCGIAYDKWQAPNTDTNARRGTAKEESEADEYSFTQREVRSFKQIFCATFFSIPERMDSISFWGRAIVLALFAVWGASFIIRGIHWPSINSSFLHAVILPFHEFGHVLFSPFGRFMAILGGSLFQVLMPLGILLVFSLKYRDNFAASIMLWWSGHSFIDVSPYIQDAEYRMMPLISGMGEESHDWGNLLRMTNSLDSAQTLANISFSIGTMLMVLGIAWGSYLLFKIKQQGLED